MSGADDQPLSWRRALRGAAFGLAALLAASCAGLQGDLEPATPAAPSVTVAPLPPPAPRAENAAPRVPPQVARSVGGLYANPEIERRLASILARLVPASERPELRYGVSILNSPVVNAFALPDGQLFVTRGLLALANDEAEVAAVLAHEMAHVIARHALARSEQSQSVILGSRVLSAVTGDRQAGQQALLAGAISLASFSRQQELEADAIGIRNLFRAGYDPYAAARFLETMDRYGALNSGLMNQRLDERESAFLSTHPSTPERLARAVAAARELAGPDIGARERDQLLRMVDGMTYGDDPRTGLVRGQSYLHPGFGFAFTAPPGFALENTARAVIGVAPDGRALRFDTIRVPATTTLVEALAGSSTNELQIDPPDAQQINGFAAATALGRAPGWIFRFVLIRFGNDVYRFIFAARSPNAEQDQEFLAAARSFRRLDAEERAAIRPFRVRVVMAREGETVEALAEGMAGEGRRMERFLVLNGLTRSSPIRAGQRFKVIGE